MSSLSHNAREKATACSQCLRDESALVAAAAAAGRNLPAGVCGGCRLCSDCHGRPYCGLAHGGAESDAPCGMCERCTGGLTCTPAAAQGAPARPACARCNRPAAILCGRCGCCRGCAEDDDAALCAHCGECSVCSERPHCAACGICGDCDELGPFCADCERCRGCGCDCGRRDE